MKKMIFTLGLAMIFALSATAQSKAMFDEYTMGTVIYTDGQSIQSKLNYNMLTGLVMFLSPQGNEMILTNPDAVRLLQIDGRIFQHIKGDEFYEKISTPSKKVYYVKWLSTPISAGKAAGYGGYSQTSFKSDMRTQNALGTLAGIKQDEIFNYDEANKYFIVVDGKMKQFSSIKTVIKLFPDHAADIEEFIKLQKISFKSSADIAKLMEFCSPFM